MKKVLLKINIKKINSYIQVKIVGFIVNRGRLFLKKAQLQFSLFKDKLVVFRNTAIGKIKEELNIVSKKVTYYYYLSLFFLGKNLYLIPKVVKHLISRMLKYWFEIFSFFYLTSILFLPFFFNSIFDVSSIISEGQSFFLNSAVMVGGSLAIIAGFAQFTIQQASESFPKDFYKIVVNITKYFFIFLVTALISLSLFFSSIFYGKLYLGYSKLSINVGLVLIGISFYLVILLLFQVYKDVDKKQVLEKVSANFKKKLRELHKNTLAYAKILLLHPENRANASLNQITASLYQAESIQAYLEYIQKELRYLFDYHDSFLIKEEKQAALEVLQQLESIISEYLKIRKDSSIAFPDPSYILVMRSDSQNMIHPILEKTVTLGEGYIKNDFTEGLVQFTNMYSNLFRVAATIEHIGVTRENPILTNIQGNFNNFVDIAIKRSSFEGLFQSVKFYNTVNVVAIDKWYPTLLMTGLEKAEKIALEASKSNQSVVLSQVSQLYADSLYLMVTKYLNRSRHLLDILFKPLENVIIYGYYSSVNGIIKDVNISQELAKPLGVLRGLISLYIQQFNQNQELEDREKFQDTVVLLVEKNYRILRDLPEYIQNPNNHLVYYIGKYIKEVGVELVKVVNEDGWNSYSRTIRREIQSLIYLPAFYIPRESKIDDSHSLDKLLDAISIIAIEAASRSMIDESKSAIEQLFNQAIKFLEKEKKGEGALYIEPSIMERACHISIVLLAKGQESIVEFIKEKIDIFERKYFETYFAPSNVPEGIDPYTLSPSPDKLKIQLQKLLTSRFTDSLFSSNSGVPLDSSERQMFKYVDRRNIQTFIEKIWPEES